MPNLAGGSRYLQVTSSATTAYIGGQYELVQTGSEIGEISYVGNFRRHERVAGQTSYRYLHRDHLESVTAITWRNPDPFVQVPELPIQG